MQNASPPTASRRHQSKTSRRRVTPLIALVVAGAVAHPLAHADEAALRA